MRNTSSHPKEEWTLEDDCRLVDAILRLLPRQDFARYATLLNKKDSQAVRYRWRVLIKRLKGTEKSTVANIYE